jgi:hypothetical protein
MSEYGFLLVLFLLLYLGECAVWVPAGSVAFCGFSGPARRLTLVTKPRTPPRSRIAFTIPFWLRNDIFVCGPSCLSVSPIGFAVNSTSKKTFTAFDEMARIAVEDDKLLINSSAFAVNCPEIQITELANWLKRLQGQSERMRILEIDKKIAHAFDIECADACLKRFTEATLPLHLDGLILLFAIFMLSPVVAWRWGLAASWPYIVSYLIFNASLVAWDFCSADRTLSSTERTRWGTIAIILLSPAAAVRASKFLARDVAFEHHALAYAASRCSQASFRNLASWFLRESMFEPKIEGVSDQRCAESEEWFRLRIQRQILLVVRGHGDDPEAVITPFARESDQVHSYCPRCLAQFLTFEGYCSDCGSVPLRHFDRQVDDKGAL